MAGGLFDPLGTDRADSRPVSRPSFPIVMTGVTVAVVMLLIAISYLRDNGDRGLPMAVSTIEHVVDPPKTSTAPAAAAGSTDGRSTDADQDVEIQNGVRIIRPRRDRSSSLGQVVTMPAPSRPDTAAGR